MEKKAKDEKKNGEISLSQDAQEKIIIGKKNKKILKIIYLIKMLL